MDRAKIVKLLDSLTPEVSASKVLKDVKKSELIDLLVEFNNDLSQGGELISSLKAMVEDKTKDAEGLEERVTKLQESLKKAEAKATEANDKAIAARNETIDAKTTVSVIKEQNQALQDRYNNIVGLEHEMTEKNDTLRGYLWTESIVFVVYIILSTLVF